MKIVMEYPDFEESDSEHIEEGRGLVAKAGGTVISVRTDEDDGVAYILANVPKDEYDGFRSYAEDYGWEVTRY